MLPLYHDKITSMCEQDKINDLHRGIEEKLRSSVRDAIEIGRLLTGQKAKLNHGDFLPWLKANCNFSDETARKYMKLHIHKSKIQGSWNLQEAYRQIEEIETVEKQKESERQNEKIF